MLALLNSENHIHNLADFDWESPPLAGADSSVADSRIEPAMSVQLPKPAYVMLRIRRRLTLYAGMAAAGAAFYALVH